METVICKKCGKKFGYGLVGIVYPGGKDRETADCPYCGETVASIMTSQTFYVEKMEDDNKQNWSSIGLNINRVLDFTNFRSIKGGG